MSLRVRLMISIAMVLLVCLAFDGGFVYRHAVGKLDTEFASGSRLARTPSKMLSPRG